MAAARNPAPIFVLTRIVDMMGKLTDEPGHGWTKIECASKKAYGCGEHGQEAVEGLKLYVRLGDDPLLTSSLTIRMSEEALRRFNSQLELGCPPRLRGECTHHQMTAVGAVQMAEEQDLTVILVVFRRNFCPELAYYLVYDHIGASLSMIKYLPDLYGKVSTMKPVPKRHGSDFELFLMARQSSPCDALCVCTPETRANPASEGTGPWQIKRLCFQHEEIQEPFKADVAFSLQGKGFWADLSQGLVYSDLHTSGVVDCGFIGLPRESQRDLAPMEMDEMEMDEPMKLTRTMGCVRDSIWFVCIDRATQYADDLVKMWTLKLPRGNLQKARWEIAKEVPVSELWGLDSFKMAGLPEGPFEYPVLTPDGDLSVMLADQRKFPRSSNQLTMEDDICVFDISLKRLRWHGLVHNYGWFDHVIFPSNFLPRKHGSRKRRVDGHCPAAGLAALAGSKQWVD